MGQMRDDQRVAIGHRIQRVAIVGGTHGNELTGVYLIKEFQRSPQTLNYQTFSVQTLLANPKAIELNRRYVDQDLNRCFGAMALESPVRESYEAKQAKAIAAQLLPTHSPTTDLILDLHSTTANMGITLIPGSPHPYNLSLAARLCADDPQIQICFRDQAHRQSSMLRSLVPFGFTIEVGPIAHGTINAKIFQKTQQVIGNLLDLVEADNLCQTESLPNSLTIYQTIGTLDYPRDGDGVLIAAIHPERDAQDFQPMQPGEPAFLTWQGDAIAYQGKETVYPVFINEAAYYEKNIAMVLTQPQDYPLYSNTRE